jgi:hypothetical protein
MHLLRLTSQRPGPMGEIPELGAQGDLPERRSLAEAAGPVRASNCEPGRRGRGPGGASDGSSAHRDARRCGGQAGYRRSAEEAALATVLAR